MVFSCFFTMFYVVFPNFYHKALIFSSTIFDNKETQKSVANTLFFDHFANEKSPHRTNLDGWNDGGNVMLRNPGGLRCK